MLGTFHCSATCYRFVLSLVVANLLTAFIVIPLLLVQLLHREEAPLWWLSKVSFGLTTFAITAAILSVLAIAVDCYKAVLSPLHYTMTVTRGRSRAMIVCAWGVAGLLATPSFLGFLVPPFPATLVAHYSNYTAGAGGEVWHITYAMLLVAVSFTLPLFALCWIYVQMYFAAHRNSERTRRHSISANPGEVVCSRGGSLDLPIPLTSTGTPENFRRTWKSPRLSIGMPKRRSSNASITVLFFREEGRAVKTATMIITSYLFCWTPYFVTLLIDSWRMFVSGTDTYAVRPNLVSEPVRSLALLTALSSGCITPFIYVFRNEVARSEAVTVLLWWRAGGSKYGGNVARCSRDLETYNSNGEPVAGENGFGPPAVQHDSFALRRQSLSYCDSVSLQSFHIPTTTLAFSSESHRCKNAPANTQGPGTSDFVATYKVTETPKVEETKKNHTEICGEARPMTKETRRENVTFHLTFHPQRLCQTCIRQNSDSSTGSGHPLVQHAEGTESSGTPPTMKLIYSRPVSSLVTMIVSQRRQRFLTRRQGSSGEELTPESKSEIPPHVMQLSRRLTDREEEDTSLDIPQKLFAQNNKNNPANKNKAVILELEEEPNIVGCAETRSATVFQV